MTIKMTKRSYEVTASILLTFKQNLAYFITFALTFFL